MVAPGATRPPIIRLHAGPALRTNRAPVALGLQEIAPAAETLEPASDLRDCRGTMASEAVGGPPSVATEFSSSLLSRVHLAAPARNAAMKRAVFGSKDWWTATEIQQLNGGVTDAADSDLEQGVDVRRPARFEVANRAI